MIPAAYLIDLYWVRALAGAARLEARKITNEMGYPALLWFRDGGRECVIEVDAIVGAVDVYLGLDHYSRRLRRRMSRGGGAIDTVITGYGMYPFRA
jgi:hypothetical protein